MSNHGAAGEIMALSWPSGKVLWRVPNQHGHDVQGLPGGHVLYSIGAAHKVVEMDAEHHTVWEYGAAEGLEHPLAAQRLPNGNTLIGDAKLGKVIEVDPAAQDRLAIREPGHGQHAHAQLPPHRRRHHADLDRSGGQDHRSGPRRQDRLDLRRPEPKRTPYQAHRLPNGNTRVGMADPGEVVEVDKSGKVVRSIAGGQGRLKMSWCSGTQELPGGGLLISDYTGKRLVEVDADGKLVHELHTGNWGIASVSLVR